jgi:hypothetical protein
MALGVWMAWGMSNLYSNCEYIKIFAIISLFEDLPSFRWIRIEQAVQNRP